MERIGRDGSQYYTSLQSGEVLSISERLFGNFFAYIVDIRAARSLAIDETFVTADPLISLSFKARVLYGVINAKTVALTIEDPLAKFYDRIVAVLRREIARMPHLSINELWCERIINSVGTVQHLGLAVEGVDFINLGHDAEFIADITKDRDHTREIHQQQHNHRIKRSDVVEQTQLDKIIKHSEIELRQDVINGINLNDLNTLLHMHPELIGPIFHARNEREQKLLEHQLKHDAVFSARLLQVLDNYIKENPETDPEALMRLINEAAIQSKTISQRINFGQQAQASIPGITFGKLIQGDSTSPNQPSSTIPTDDD